MARISVSKGILLLDLDGKALDVSTSERIHSWPSSTLCLIYRKLLETHPFMSCLGERQMPFSFSSDCVK